jgi:hypothetical protein
MNVSSEENAGEDMDDYDLEQYVHVLLFACSHCERPLVATCVSSSKSLELAEAKWFNPTCHCGWKEDLSGVTAMKHWVEVWHGKPIDPGDAASCDQETQRVEKGMRR